ncbi:MAG TPA: putative entry exclusion protein TrbK-alt [Novosphingobium sp.]|nr:putative entry exclusion protein TrbK-alt [Novosphingobium sp.]
MKRNVKVAAALALGGGLMALAILGAEVPDISAAGTEISRPGAAPDPDVVRCRTLTMPDSHCEHAWEERRRRFFGARDNGKDRP